MMKHGVGVLNMADNGCPQLPDIYRGDRHRRRIGNLRSFADQLFLSEEKKMVF